MKDNVSADHVVTKAPASQPQSVLSLSDMYSIQFLDGVHATTVQRILLQDLDYLGVSIKQVVMMSMQTPHDAKALSDVLNTPDYDLSSDVFAAASTSVSISQGLDVADIALTKANIAFGVAGAVLTAIQQISIVSGIAQSSMPATTKVVRATASIGVAIATIGAGMALTDTAVAALATAPATGGLSLVAAAVVIGATIVASMLLSDQVSRQFQQIAVNLP